LQRKRADCGIASPVIAALGGQNANRQSEQERGGDSDYAFGHHGSPLGFYVTLQPWQFIQPLPVMAVTDFANMVMAVTDFANTEGLTPTRQRQRQRRVGSLCGR
jgi:hypothetical protein